MARLICGRCGQAAAPGSTYCPQDGWLLVAPQEVTPEPALVIDAGREYQPPATSGGFLARRRLEGARDALERACRTESERRLSALEKRLGAAPESAALHRDLGLLALLEGQTERAHASLERAYALDASDLETQVNSAIALARRGQWQPALARLQSARAQSPAAPPVLFNLALVAVQARRAPLALECVAELETLWLADAALALEWRDAALSVRARALLEQHPADALRELEAVWPSVEENGWEPPANASADALNDLALAHAALGQNGVALTGFRAALEREPGHIEALGNLGVMALRAGNFEAARRALDAARHIAEAVGAPDAAIWNHLGVMRSALGQNDEALDCFARASGAQAAEFEAFFNLGRAHIAAGQPDAGLEALRRCFDLDPNNADWHTVLGAAYLLRGRAQLWPDAIKYLKRALQLDAQGRVAATNLALALMQSGSLDAAQKLLAQGQRLFPSAPENAFLAGLLALERAAGAPEPEPFWASAASHFEAAYGARPDWTAALYNAALCQFLCGLRDGASKLLDLATQRDPSLGPAYYLIGFGHAEARRDAPALSAWQTAIPYEPQNPDLHANLAALLYRRGNSEGAVSSYLTAHRLLPRDAGILSALGVVLAQRKMFHQAISVLNQSLQIDPSSPVTHSNLGLAYYLFSQVERAMDHWRTVSKLDSRYAARREEEQQRSFDDSVVQLRPLNWRARVAKMAPILPPPQTRLMVADARAYRPIIADPALQTLAAQQEEVARTNRTLARLNLK